MTQQSDFAVPIDDLQPRTREPLPNGKYLGEVTLGKAENGKGWEAVEVTVTNITTPQGGVEVQRRVGDAVRLGGQTRRTRITAANTGDSSGAAKSVEIGRGQIVALAYALGLAQIGTTAEGKPAAIFEFSSTEDALEQLSAGNGLRVGFSISNKARKRNGVVVNGDDGNPIMDDEIARFYPAATVAKEG